MFEATNEQPSVRDRILEAALRLFYTHGIRATGIERIITEAGVARMSFYYHFKSKDELVEAFLHERHRRWMKWFDTRTRPNDSPRRGGALVAVADALEEWFADDGFRGCAFINSVGETADLSPAVVRIAREHKSALSDRLMALAVIDGVEHADDAAAAALLVVEGAIVRAQMSGSAKEAAATARRLLAAIAAGFPGEAPSVTEKG